jgi:hypothetical protein
MVDKNSVLDPGGRRREAWRRGYTFRRYGSRCRAPLASPACRQTWRFRWPKKILDAVDHGVELGATDHGVNLCNPKRPTPVRAFIPDAHRRPRRARLTSPSRSAPGSPAAPRPPRLLLPARQPRRAHLVSLAAAPPPAPRRPPSVWWPAAVVGRASSTDGLHRASSSSTTPPPPTVSLPLLFLHFLLVFLALVILYIG